MAEKGFSVLEKLAEIEKVVEQDFSLATYEAPSLELVRQAALSASEQLEMEEFIANGYPNLESYDRPRMLSLYLAGHDTADLIKIFPICTKGGIAFLKAKDSWKIKREEFLEDLNFRSRLRIANAKQKTLYTITSLLDTFNNKLEPHLLKYSATGDINDLPAEIVPKSLREVEKLLNMLKAFSDLRMNDSEKKPNTAIQINVSPNETKVKESDAFEFLKNDSKNSEK